MRWRESPRKRLIYKKVSTQGAVAGRVPTYWTISQMHFRALRCSWDSGQLLYSRLLECCGSYRIATAGQPARYGSLASRYRPRRRQNRTGTPLPIIPDKYRTERYVYGLESRVPYLHSSCRIMLQFSVLAVFTHEAHPTPL